MISMTRRRLLRTIGGAVLGGAAAGVAACRPSAPGDEVGEGDRRAEEGTDGVALRSLTRPVLRPWAEDMVWLDAPPSELPVAYVSMARRQVFVDRAYRDRAAWLLAAHISVSTALWRIPLPGDPEGEPITPGDQQREFEERSMRDWDPTLAPAMDDVRMSLGAPVPVRVELSCVPLVGRMEPVGGEGGDVAGARADADEAWLAAEPWTIHVVGGAGDEPVREDFMVIGRGTRHRDRSCSDGGDAVQYVGWAIRD
jgi:hypothetical protein